MILTGNKIRDEVRRGNITLSPFSDSLVNPNSYNYRLGDKLVVYKDDVLDAKSKGISESFTIDESGYILEPNKLYLGSTYEEIGSDLYVPSLIGRSSIGRLGLFLQITADLGHLGTVHKWTLELHVVQPLRIYPGMIIGQVSFWEPMGDTCEMYTDINKYKQHSKPCISKLYQELS